MPRRRGADAIDALRSDLRRRLKAERDVCAVNIVVDGLGQPDDVAALGAQERRRLVRARPAQRKQAVQSHLLIVGTHFLQSRFAVFFHRHQFIGLAGSSQNGAAAIEYVGKILSPQRAALAADEPAVPFRNADDLDVFHVIEGIQPDGADDRVQPGAIASAR